MRAKIVNQSSDFPVRRTGSYRHKKNTAYELMNLFQENTAPVTTTGLGLLNETSSSAITERPRCKVG